MVARRGGQACVLLARLGMLEKWLDAVLAERARILERVAPIPEPKIDEDLARQDVYAAAAALLAWERHTGAKLEEDAFREALAAQMKKETGYHG